jgi:hypothetical protein
MDRLGKIFRLTRICLGDPLAVAARIPGVRCKSILLSNKHFHPRDAEFRSTPLPQEMTRWQSC